MSYQATEGSMSDADEIVALRADMAATAAEHMAAAERSKAAAASALASADAASQGAAKDHAASAIEHEQAAQEIADLQAKAAADGMPDAQIKAGIAAIKEKFRHLFA